MIVIWLQLTVKYWILAWQFRTFCEILKKKLNALFVLIDIFFFNSPTSQTIPMINFAYLWIITRYYDLPITLVISIVTQIYCMKRNESDNFMLNSLLNVKLLILSFYLFFKVNRFIFLPLTLWCEKKISQVPFLHKSHKSC